MRYLPAFVLVIAVALLPPPAWAEGELPREKIAQVGKAATALVECSLPRGKGYGSAFCVHSSGLFVTNAHVVEMPGVATISLVLDPSLKTQRIVAAKVLRLDKENDLALLRAEGVKDLPTLSLGSANGLVETMEIIAFGFPFGALLSDNRRDPPAISVNVGSITSLRRKSDMLHRIQVDAVLNPGNSGGPVLDKRGHVVGVVVAGIRGAQVNFAIPVNIVATFLSQPELEFKPPSVDRAVMHKPVAFEARAVAVVPTEKPLRLELVLKTEDGKERKFPMEGKNGVYRVTVIPVPPSEGPVPMRATIAFANGSVVGPVADRAIKIGDKEHKLSELRGVRWQPKPTTVLADGKTIEGAVAGIDFLDVTLGKETVRLNLASAVSARFEVTTPATTVACTVVVSQENAVVGRTSANLTFTSPASSGDDVIGPGPITGVEATAFDGDKAVRPLPAPAADAVMGGGGRYLILHLPKLRKLAIFDVPAAKIVDYIALSGDNVKFAAGLEKLIVVYPDNNLIQRWDLATRQREVTAVLAPKEKIHQVALGSASRGPILICCTNNSSFGEFFFVDLATLKQGTIPFEGRTGFLAMSDAPLRASADGQTFGVFKPNSSPQFVQTVVVANGKATVFTEGGSVGHIIPGPDGKTIFTGRGLFTQEAKRIGKEDRNAPYCLPAVQGVYYLTLNLNVPPGQKYGAAIHLPGDERPLVTLSDLELPQGMNAWDREPFAWDRRIHFIPDAKVLISIPMTNDKLVLHRVDVEKALEKSGLDYLFVTSRSPDTVGKGATLSYQVLVKSRKGGVKYRLDSGPKGMEVTKDGLLKWDVPADFGDAEVNVVLSIGDATGQEIFHTFALKVRP